MGLIGKRDPGLYQGRKRQGDEHTKGTHDELLGGSLGFRKPGKPAFVLLGVVRLGVVPPKRRADRANYCLVRGSSQSLTPCAPKPSALAKTNEQGSGRGLRAGKQRRDKLWPELRLWRGFSRGSSSGENPPLRTRLSLGWSPA